MATRAYLEMLTQVHLTPDWRARRRLWEGGLRALAAHIDATQMPLPLEGADPVELLRSVRVALGDFPLPELQTRTDLDEVYVAVDPAIVSALYELGAALPDGDEKRQLGRYVLGVVQQAPLSHFVALATRLALGHGRALRDGPYSAQLLLSMESADALRPAADQLAAALLQNPMLVRTFLVQGSRGSIAARRLAARILERASRACLEAERKGSDSVRDHLDATEAQVVWERLAADREPMVWRFAASARGLIKADSGIGPDTEASLTDATPALTVLSRRLCMLVSALDTAPEATVRRVKRAMTYPALNKYGTLRAALIWGLPTAAEAQPEAAAEILRAVLKHMDASIVDPLLTIWEEGLPGAFEALFVRAVQDAFREAHTQSPDAFAGSLKAAALQRVLAGDVHETPLGLSLRYALSLALTERGDRASAQARDALVLLDAALERLQTQELDSVDAQVDVYMLLREVDQAVLRHGIFAALLEQGVDAPLAARFEKLVACVVDAENAERYAAHPELAALWAQFTLRVADADGRRVDRNKERLRRRRQALHVALLHRCHQDLAAGQPSRAFLVALARLTDAMLREESLELSDAFSILTMRFANADAIKVFSEALMFSDLERVLVTYLALNQAEPRRGATQIMRLTLTFSLDAGARVRALRKALGELADAVALIDAVEDFMSLTESGAVPRLNLAILSLAQLVAGSLRRADLLESWEVPDLERCLDHIERDLVIAAHGEVDPLRAALEQLDAFLSKLLPPYLGGVVRVATARLTSLSSERREWRLPAQTRTRAALPGWMPPTRTLGGFFVSHALGSGAGGSVFAAKRIEERDRTDAPWFALKVPEFRAVGAHMSEDAFLELFRREARALLSMPQHPALAHFVTFDAGCKPKPILVMELVPGLSLDRVLESIRPEARLAYGWLARLAEGLDCMHVEGIAHLDIKPGNIILRHVEDAAQMAAGEPVLVDFGLSGRAIRAGCGTPGYSPPEVWATTTRAEPAPADVYAMACIAFEILTGTPLFDAMHEVAMISAHLDPKEALAKLEALGPPLMSPPLGALLTRAIAVDPAERPSMAVLQEHFATASR